MVSAAWRVSVAVVGVGALYYTDHPAEQDSVEHAVGERWGDQSTRSLVDESKHRSHGRIVGDEVNDHADRRQEHEYQVQMKEREDETCKSDCEHRRKRFSQPPLEDTAEEKLLYGTDDQD